MEKSVKKNVSASQCETEVAPYSPPAREENKGISESTAVISRGLAFAFPAYFLGKVIAGPFLTQKGIRVGRSDKITGYVFAATAAILGSYHASRDARAESRQFNRLQKDIAKLDKQNYDLKAELKAQLCGEGTLTEYDPSWDRPAEPEPSENPEPEDHVESLIETSFPEESPEKSIKADTTSQEPLTQEMRERS